MRLTETDMVAYTYAIHWTQHNKSYYGIRYARNCRTSDLWSTYFTSSKKVKEFREEFGEPDIILIDQMFLSVEEARYYEECILKESNVAKNDSWLNQNDRRGFPSASGVDHPHWGRKLTDDQKEALRVSNIGRRASAETKAKLSRIHKGRKHSEETKAKMSLIQKNVDRSYMIGDNNPMKRDDVKAKMRGANNPSCRPDVVAKRTPKLIDHTLRVFIHSDHGKHITTTFKLRESFNLDQGHMSKLISGSRRIHKGWTYHGVYQPEQ